MRYISLFSGIEAASVAWKDLDGWEPVAFSEIDKFPSAVLAYRFPKVPNLGDITKIDWSEVIAKHGAVDLIVGGSPCQSFSIAGGRESLDGESRLMFEYIRAVQDVRPKWFLWENVPGVLSTRDNAFEQLLTEMEKLGYGMAYGTLDAQFFGVAQRRRRVFLVGCFGNGGASAAVLFEQNSVSGNTQTSKQKREELTRAARGSIDSYRPKQLENSNEPILCLGSDTVNCAVDYDMSGTLHVGGSQPIVLLSNGEEITGPVCARDYKGVGNEFVSEGKVVAIGNVVNSSGKDTVGALCARDRFPFSRQYVDQGKVVCYPYVLKTRGGADTYIKRDGKVGTAGKGALVGDDVAFTIAASQDQTLIDVCNYIVRRITPKERERLQGFPDDWTLIPYRGKPAEECPDAPRYKALGNSMAVPVMRWLGERIQMVDEIIKEIND